MQLVEPATWTLACPCDTPRATTPAQVAIDEHDFRTKRIRAGMLYYRPRGPVFQDVFFRPTADPAGAMAPTTPLKVYLEITNRCNLDCQVCYVPKGPSDMGYAQATALIDGIADTDAIGVQLLGGEPTLHPDLSRLCAHIADGGLKTELVTNGYLSPDELIRSLAGTVGLVVVSIDGTEHTHDALRRRRGSFLRARESLVRYTEAGFDTSVLMTLNRANFREVGQVRELAMSVGSRFKLKRMLARPEWLRRVRGLYMGIEEALSTEAAALCIGEGVAEMGGATGEAGHLGYCGCPGGRLGVSVDVHGDVRRCVYDRRPDRCWGNVWEEPYEEICTRMNSRMLVCESPCELEQRCGGPCRLNERHTPREAKNVHVDPARRKNGPSFEP